MLLLNFPALFLIALMIVAHLVGERCKKVGKEVTKEKPNLLLRRQPSVLATAAASYFQGLMRRESKSKMSKNKSGGKFVNPMVSSGTTGGELQMADRSRTAKTKDMDTSMITSARDSASEKGSNEGHLPLPEHWEAFKDDVSGNYYYYNHETRESQWEAPI